MNNGYPVEADIDLFMAGLGIEIPDEFENPWMLSFKRLMYNLIKASEWAAVLGVYCPTPTTFNVRGGHYNYDAAVKEFVPGVAVDPTDNDTTYIWLNSDNTIGSGIDGDDWPVTEHVKLAEIDVDASGVIVEVRDLRGQTFMRFVSGS